MEDQTATTTTITTTPPMTVLEYGTRDPSWMVECVQTATDALELRDPPQSLVATVVTKPKDIVVLVVAPALTAFSVLASVAVGMTQDWVGLMLTIGVVFGGVLCMSGVLLEIYCRWRRPSLVRVQGASLALHRPAWSEKPLRVWDLRQVTKVASVLGSNKHHALCSIVMYLRDDSRASFLFCRNRHESEWIAKQIQYRVDQAKAAVLQVPAEVTAQIPAQVPAPQQ